MVIFFLFGSLGSVSDTFFIIMKYIVHVYILMKRDLSVNISEKNRYA